MNPNDSVDDFVKELFRGVRVHECSYDDLAHVTRQWVEFVERRFAQAGPEAVTPSGYYLDRIARFFRDRHFAAFRARLNARSSVERALLEFFLLTRIRMYVLAYLSVQEGEEFEGAASYETLIPIFFSQVLRRMGRRPSLTFNPGVGRLRLRVGIDPLVHLRAMYGTLLLAARRGRALSIWARARIAYHQFGFSLKARLLTVAARWGIKGYKNLDDAAGIRALLRNRVMRRFVAMAVLILFPDARALTEPDWLALLRRLEEYFVPRLADLLEVLPEQSLRDHGLIKLFKVAFGTLAGRIAVRDVHEKDHVDFIFNTLRVAYSWGVTYPLVDNVLDSASTNQAVREELTRALTDLFAGNGGRDAAAFANAGVREVYQRLAEVLSLIPAARLPQTRRALGLLLQSHQRDSARRLSALAATCSDDIWNGVMVDTALKAALVRLATMEVCGIVVDETTVARGLIRSLFNQLGDDLWDIYEDFDDDRVTPYTLYLTKGGSRNPFDFYLDYSVLLARGVSKRRQAAVFMGFCETLRDSLLALRDRNGDPLGVSKAIADTLTRSARTSVGDLVPGVPHVDFDAVLFAFETALFEIAFRP